jgi:hypothetical protein
MSALIPWLISPSQVLKSTPLYPTPVKEILNVSLAEPANTNIATFNLFGQQVLTKTATTKNVAIPFSELKSGVYLARIEAEGQVITKKFVKH